MKPEQTIRYSRHISLSQVGAHGQEKLLSSKILIVGLGGLGCAAAYYLAAAGVGTLYLSDNEIVELSNLQRQILYTTEDVGTLKTVAAKKHLLALNPELQIHTLPGFPVKELSDVDIVLDCTDNFATRFAINHACVEYKIPLISGSALAWKGQVGFFNLENENNACYACLYPEQTNESAQPENCENNGVMGPLVGIVGNMQALLALKKLINKNEWKGSQLYSFNALSMEWKNNKIEKDPKHEH
jgi:molybdopterin-synthase adenylyltransferase